MLSPKLRAAGLAVAALAAGWSISTPAAAQTVVTDFSAGQANGAYAFSSWAPKTLPDFLKGAGRDQRANIVGHLFLPKGNDKEKAPAIILMHGSGGIYHAMLEYWPRRLNAAGIAVFSLDTFGPRGVKSTAEDQSQVPFGADLADVFEALKLLATHPRIDPQRIAIMGFSRGGISAWRTNVARVVSSQNLPNGLQFAAHIPVYSGGCNGLFRLAVKPGVFKPSPMLWIHGDADDYTPIGPCRDYAGKIGKAGTPVEFVELKGARHKFDYDDSRLVKVAGAQRTAEDCPLETDIDTLAVYDSKTGQRLQGEAFQATMKKCGMRGASVQGNSAARDKAADAILAFLKKTFAR